MNPGPSVDNGNVDTSSDSENANNNSSGSSKGAVGGTLVISKTHTPRSSAEDLSEYTDADESLSSAPTEFLAEFLSAIMMKNYEAALKYCKLILQYEPNNATAKEFYPLIMDKLKQMEEEQDHSTTSEDISNGNESSDGEGKRSSTSESDSDATTASYSSLEDEEADDNQTNSKPNKFQGVDGNGNTESGPSSGTLGAIKDIITHVPEIISTTLSTSGNIITSAFQSTSSDSESPTDPVSQQSIVDLHAKAAQTK